MATLFQVLRVGRLAFTLNVAILRQPLSQSFMFGGLHLTIDAATFRTSFLQVLPSGGLPFFGLPCQLCSKCFMWEGWPLLLL
jgi:hypothetical protein